MSVDISQFTNDARIVRYRFGGWTMRTLPLIAICIFLNVGFSQAQQSMPGTLSGIKQIGLFVDKADFANKSCGITEKMMRDAVMYPLSSARLRIAQSNSPDVPTLGIGITTISAPIRANVRMCVSTIRI